MLGCRLDSVTIHRFVFRSRLFFRAYFAGTFQSRINRYSIISSYGLPKTVKLSCLSRGHAKSMYRVRVLLLGLAVCAWFVARIFDQIIGLGLGYLRII